MKVVHVNISGEKGGAGIAAFRLHKAMRQTGIDSSMLVANKPIRNTFNEHVYRLKREDIIKISVYNLLERLFFKLFGTISYWAFGFWGIDISKHSLLLEADAIFIHWINDGMLSISGVQKILKLKKDVYWFMHDMWPITGGCHYAFNCLGYKHKCGNCPLLTRFRMKADISHFLQQKKYFKWHNFSNLHVITPSKWLNICVKQSNIFYDKLSYICPNIIDTEIYKPYSNEVARKYFNLPDNSKKLILFGADSIYSPYKGWSYLLEALKVLFDNQNNVECVIFGSSENKELCQSISLPVHFVGRLSDDQSLALIYSAVDVLVVPSLADNFPNVIAESLCCGTPVVGFDIGGIPELILHKKNGYLARYRDSNDLAHGIDWVLNLENIINLKKNSRQFALSNLSMNCIEKYYENILKYKS